ncbi:hypothetical protein SLEP1_g18347 [Rubroshorea leprosula]|uniref:Uncharacterized protein n=1 Tax=Rubroshorea leprosula TaxID=152421 RepID=A0AAV5J322_9ROSI|nr:hypothetical protein SLEP1_g18347 [Rubroshorea leprosula]
MPVDFLFSFAEERGKRVLTSETSLFYCGVTFPRVAITGSWSKSVTHPKA